MANLVPSHPSHKPKTEDRQEDDDCKETLRTYNHMLQSLPKDKGWINEHLIQYQGFWFSPPVLPGVMLTQTHFNSQTSDIFLAAFPKSGTTWLKALTYAVATRSQFDLSTHPLRVRGPHDCVPFVELYDPNWSDFKSLPSPRLLATHIPYPLLPKSLIGSGCRLIYLWRNPRDVFVSLWHFMNEVRMRELPPLKLEEAFDLFCKGVTDGGPYWDHVIGYYKASMESPDKVLFLKYEDMKKNPLIYVKKIGQFVGKAFTLKEENEGVVDEIIRLCSIQSLKNLEVNKSGVQQFDTNFRVENRLFFRKGAVGDSKNYLTMEMIRQLDQISNEKFSGFDLSFEDHLDVV